MRHMALIDNYQVSRVGKNHFHYTIYLYYISIAVLQFFYDSSSDTSMEKPLEKTATLFLLSYFKGLRKSEAV